MHVIFKPTMLPKGVAFIFPIRRNLLEDGCINAPKGPANNGRHMGRTEVPSIRTCDDFIR